MTPERIAEIRKEIVDETLSWERTPYHDYARIKGVGVDCAMLPAAVYEAVGLTPHIDPVYSKQWMLHHDSEEYLRWVLPYAEEVPPSAVGPGDLVLWQFGRTYSHGAIVLDLPWVMHAVKRGRAVIRANIEAEVDLRDRPKRFFSFVKAD